MPTPLSTFLDIAAQYGGVDRTDPEAVQNWFMDDLPALPTETIKEILDALMASDESSDDQRPPRSYPKGVPLPSLSGSPTAATPILAGSWRDFLVRLLGRNP